MKNELIQLIESKSPGSIPLYLVIRGSHAYGTNIPTSDTDYSGVFVQNLDSILGMSYVDQINDDKNDIVIYELRRFLELLAKNNPTILELLNTPEDCIIYKHPVFDEILSHKDKFITKICAQSFGGYAVMQIKKAKGQDKKQNWERDRVIRKTPLDFCYLHDKDKSVSLVSFLEENGYDQSLCGLTKVPHSRDTYSLFYDYDAHNTARPVRLRGIAFENSNDIRLSSIPKEDAVDSKGITFIGHLSYNKDGYTSHCDDYKSYQEWLSKRNEQRWVDVKTHDQKIDGKNMMHCLRLTQMSKEIAEGKGIIVRRPNAQELISVRKGEIDLQSLIDRVELEIKEMDELFKNSSLPDRVDMGFVNELLIKIRKSLYNLND